MFGWKEIDRSIYEISVFYSFRLFLLLILQVLDQGSETAKKWHTKFRDVTTIDPDLKTFTYCI